MEGQRDAMHGLEPLGFNAESRVAILHVDDVGMCHGANGAFKDLSHLGTTTSGSVMVPCPWYSEAVEMARAHSNLDLGVHLTLTSEWQSYRWKPISTTSPSSGLIDENGYFWRRLPMLASHVVPEAAEAEMRAQIERALADGVDVTHLDTHMGAAVLPQLLEIYVRLARDYRLPLLLPRHLSDYTSVLEFGGTSMKGYDRTVADLEEEGWPLIDHFRMTPWAPLADSDRIYREMIAALLPGLTMISLHPNKSGDIETISPLKAHFRVDEFRLLSDPAFRQSILEQEIRTIGFRPLRDLLRTRRGF